MKIYIAPSAEEATDAQITAREHMIQVATDQGAEVVERPDTDNLRWLGPISAMIAEASSPLDDRTWNEAMYMGTQLTRHVLLLCDTGRRRDDLKAQIGDPEVAWVAAATTPVIRESAVKATIASAVGKSIRY